MAIDPINATQVGPGPTSTTPIGNSALGKDEFMKLLLTQMANQDPTEPQSNEEFIAQLAQFAALEAQQTQAAQLDALLMAQAAANQMAAVDLVGKAVTFESNTMTVTDGVPNTLDAMIDGVPENIMVSVKDASGKEVIKFPVSPENIDDAGHVTIEWPGVDKDGDPVADGEYTIQVTASRGEATEQAEALDVTVLRKAKVDGISYEDGAPVLILGDVRMLMNEVVEVWDGDDF